MLDQKILLVCNKIVEAGGRPLIVGGYVRDTLLGRNPKDVDIVVTNMIDTSMLGNSIGKDFPVFLIDGIEVALARKEKKTGIGYTGFECETENVSLEDDLFRRDLTINAIAMDPFDGHIIDPWGGVRDLRDRILRPVGPHFKEDPLRVLRAARFAAQLNMEIHDSLIEAAIEVLHEIPTISRERHWGELEKALRSPKPSLFFEALDKMGALEIVFPELSALKGRVQPEQHHPEGDAYVHTLLVVDRARELGADDETMFAALVHDLGKAVTPDDELPHHYNHEALGVPLVDLMCIRLRVPNSHRTAARAAAREHLNIHRFADLKPITKARLLARLGVVQSTTLLNRVTLAAQADAQGRGPLFHSKPYPQRDMALAAAEVVRGVHGNEFACLQDGPKIAQKIEEKRTKALKAAGF